MLEADFVIQSRLGSSRLPFKASLELPSGDSCVKGTVVRCEKIIRKLGWNKRVYIACPKDEIEIYKSLCRGTNAIIFGGDGDNVAKRFLDLTTEFNISSLIRVTADNPYICIDVVKFLSEQSTTESECISLFHQRKLPNGTVISLLSRPYLNALCNSRCKKSHEHLIISDDEEINKLIKKPNIPDYLSWPNGRFCLDDKEDYLYFFKNFKISEYLEVKEMKSKLSRRENVILY